MQSVRALSSASFFFFFSPRFVVFQESFEAIAVGNSVLQWQLAHPLSGVFFLIIQLLLIKASERSLSLFKRFVLRW